MPLKMAMLIWTLPIDSIINSTHKLERSQEWIWSRLSTLDSQMLDFLQPGFTPMRFGLRTCYTRFLIYWEIWPKISTKLRSIEQDPGCSTSSWNLALIGKPMSTLPRIYLLRIEEYLELRWPIESLRLQSRNSWAISEGTGFLTKILVCILMVMPIGSMVQMCMAWDICMLPEETPMSWLGNQYLIYYFSLFINQFC